MGLLFIPELGSATYADNVPSNQLVVWLTSFERKCHKNKASCPLFIQIMYFKWGQHFGYDPGPGIITDSNVELSTMSCNSYLHNGFQKWRGITTLW